MARFTEAERVEVWERRQRGEGNRSIGRRLGRSAGSIRAFVEANGGVRPEVRRCSPRHLSSTEREEISRGIAAGRSCPPTRHPDRCWHRLRRHLRHQQNPSRGLKFTPRWGTAER